jgi:hypothetical protein
MMAVPDDALQVLVDQSWRGRRWVVESDVANCFEAIPHSGLMSAIEERISDRYLLKLLRAMLRSGVMQDGAVMRSDDGTPQGGVVTAPTQSRTSSLSVRFRGRRSASRPTRPPNEGHGPAVGEPDRRRAHQGLARSATCRATHRRSFSLAGPSIAPPRCHADGARDDRGAARRGAAGASPYRPRATVLARRVGSRRDGAQAGLVVLRRVARGGADF